MKEIINVKDKSETGKLIKVAPFKKEIRKTQPHKHNSYFEIIYLSQGRGTHTIDHQKFSIKPPLFFFIRNEQVHHWDITAEPEGNVLILKKEFIEKSFDSELKNLLTEISSFSCLQLKESKAIEMIFELLTGENNFHAIEGLLKALLAKILETAHPFAKRSKSGNNTFQSFTQLLTDSHQLRNNVSYYAAALNTTPQNLNAICRKSANRKASDVIREHIMSEAKRLLTYTDNTVSEIAFALHFNDASHFVKYFKRATGKTPQQFRQS